MEIKFDIIDYIGQLAGGIYVVLSLNYNDNFYEGIFYYKENVVALSVEKTLEKKLNCEIEDWRGYNQLMLDILSKVVPYDQMINIANDFDKEMYDVYIPENLK
jgi:hypothetical protein